MQSQAEISDGIGRARIADGEWGLFAGLETDSEFFEHMSDRIEVQFLGEDWETGPWILPNRFPPHCKADIHAHNHDTVYYVIQGTMTFNDGSGWYSPGDLRWVRAGTEYGPEEAGSEGCTFLLVSNGPIDIQWKDSETYTVPS